MMIRSFPVFESNNTAEYGVFSGTGISADWMGRRMSIGEADINIGRRDRFDKPCKLSGYSTIRCYCV